MPKIYVSEFDFHRIYKSLSFDFNPHLYQELQRAEIVSDVMVPPDLITLDTIVYYRVEEDGEEKESMIVLPACPEGQDMVVSVYNEIGTALLGLQVGESIDWEMGGQQKTFTVLDIKYQPEAAGELHPMVFHVGSCSSHFRAGEALH